MEIRTEDQSDFDLEKMFELLDTAMTSKDERVQNAFRALLTIIALTKPQDDGRYPVETSHGPLRKMQDDLKDISRRLWSLQEEVRQLKQQPYTPSAPYTPPGSPFGPYINPGSPYGPQWGGSGGGSGINPDPGYWVTGTYGGTSLQEKEDK